MQLLTKYEDMPDLMSTLMLQSENYRLRAETARRLRGILVGCSGLEEAGDTLCTLLRIFLFDNLKYVQTDDKRCAQYFEQVRRLFTEIKVDDLKPLDEEIQGLIVQLAKEIVERKTIEENTKTEDKYLVGMMTTLRVILQKYPH